MRRIVPLLLFVFLFAGMAYSQLNEMPGEAETPEKQPLVIPQSKGATDTIMFNEFNSLPGPPTVLGYNYTNGNGYFFGTNYLDLDQDPTTPLEPGCQAIAQGYIIDSLQPYHIEAVLLRVGFKQKVSPFGTPLVLSIQYADGESSYNINTSTGTVSYTIKAPGTGLVQVSVPFDSIKAGFGTWYTRVDLPYPVEVNRNYFVMIDLADFYMNDDKIGMYASANTGASGIMGKENVLWLYPSPFLWLQVTHIYTTIDRCMAIFPIIDDGTFGIEEKPRINGIRSATVYPNPSADLITIQFDTDHTSEAMVCLLDQNGKILLREELPRLEPGLHEVQFNIQHLPAGMYFYTIETIKGNVARKFIKQ